MDKMLINEADKALDTFVTLINREVTKDIRERFDKVKEAKKHADHSVNAGREYAKAYIEFTHYAERYTFMLKCIQDIITKAHKESNSRSACMLEKKENSLRQRYAAYRVELRESV
jgi:hypothetical protein